MPIRLSMAVLNEFFLFIGEILLLLLLVDVCGILLQSASQRKPVPLKPGPGIRRKNHNLPESLHQLATIALHSRSYDQIEPVLEEGGCSC